MSNTLKPNQFCRTAIRVRYSPRFRRFSCQTEDGRRSTYHADIDQFDFDREARKAAEAWCAKHINPRYVAVVEDGWCRYGSDLFFTWQLTM